MEDTNTLKNNNIVVVIINGITGVGKDTFVEYVNLYSATSITPFKVHNFSTVDRIKDVAKMLGWNGEKTPEARKFLSDLKDLSTNFNNGPSADVFEKVQELEINSTGDHVCFIHSREPEDIERLKEMFKSYNCYTMLVDPDDTTFKKLYNPSNHADANVYNYEYYDIVVDNYRNYSEDRLEVSMSRLAAIAKMFATDETVSAILHDRLEDLSAADIFKNNFLYLSAITTSDATDDHIVESLCNNKFFPVYYFKSKKRYQNFFKYKEELIKNQNNTQPINTEE